MEKIKLNKIVFESRGGTNTIHEAEYDGSPCYAIVHVPTGHTEIIDHDDNIVKALIGRIKRSKAMTCEKKSNGYILRLLATNRERQVAFRYFVYAKYEGLRPEQVRRKKIRLIDSSALNDNILDLRSCNLYDAGKVRPYTAARSIEIVDRPGFEGEKYIAIAFHGRKNGKVEYAEYSPELYEMLASPTYCNLRYNRHNDRATVTVHSRHHRDGYVFDNLSKFILIYYRHFSRYRNMRGGIKRFIHDYKYYSREKYKGQDAAHINACKLINCACNLAFMDESPNSCMGDLIKWFLPPYDVTTAVDGDGNILIEFAGVGRFLCATPEDYLDWQRVFLGKDLTGKLKSITCATKDGYAQMLTPAGMIAVGEANKGTVKDNELGLWTWLERRDRLLSLDKKLFFAWSCGAGARRTLQDVQIPNDMTIGQPIITPFGGGYAVITLAKASNN